MDIRVAGVRHRLYIENNSSVIQKVIFAMKAKPMFIADGHHRFEVACQYKKWMSAKGRDEFGARRGAQGRSLHSMACCARRKLRDLPGSTDSSVPTPAK